MSHVTDSTRMARTENEPLVLVTRMGLVSTPEIWAIFSLSFKADHGDDWLQ